MRLEYDGECPKLHRLVRHPSVPKIRAVFAPANDGLVVDMQIYVNSPNL